MLHDPPLHLPAVVGEEDVLALAESGAGREAAEEAGPQDPGLTVLAHLHHHQLQVTADLCRTENGCAGDNSPGII